MLALIICTATDKGGKIPGFMAPVVIFVGAVGLFGALGLHGEELNPARTIGPRIVAAIFYGGDGKHDLPNPRHGLRSDNKCLRPLCPRV